MTFKILVFIGAILLLIYLCVEAFPSIYNEERSRIRYFVFAVIILALAFLSIIDWNKDNKLYKSEITVQEEILKFMSGIPLEIKENMLNSRSADGFYKVEEGIDENKLTEIFSHFDVVVYDDTSFIIIRDSKALEPNTQYHGKMDLSKGE